MNWRQKRWMTLVIVLAITALVLIVWPQLSRPDRLDITVIIKSIDPTVEFWQVLIDGVYEAAQEFDANVQVLGTKYETDVEEQIALVEQVITERPDVIVLAANDYDRLVPVANKIRSKGIKLIIVDSGINSNSALSIVSTDNVSAGNKAGQAILDQMDDSATIAIMSYVKNAASTLDREKGVREVLSGYSNIKLLETFYVDGSERNAYLKVIELLQEQPNLYGIVGLNEPTTVGAGKAIKAMKKEGSVKLIGFDSSINEIKLLEEGIMRATVIQRPFQMGYLSIKTAVEAAEGKKVPQTIDTGSLIITKTNMYEEENQKLLFPFVDK